MNPAKCDDLDYIRFLTASVGVFTCTEAARCQPEVDNSPSHDAFTRLLQRQPPDTEALWEEAKGIIQLQKGFLIIDDTILDKPYAKNMSLAEHAQSHVNYSALGLISWNIEESHRGVKQFCGIENCQARKSQSERAHILFSLRAFLRLEVEA